jgi:hypothetical protein
LCFAPGCLGCAGAGRSGDIGLGWRVARRRCRLALGLKVFWFFFFKKEQGFFLKKEAKTFFE